MTASAAARAAACGDVRRVARRDAPSSSLASLQRLPFRVVLLPTYALRGDVDQYARWCSAWRLICPSGPRTARHVVYAHAGLRVRSPCHTVPAFAIAPDAGDIGLEWPSRSRLCWRTSQSRLASPYSFALGSQGTGRCLRSSSPGDVVPQRLVEPRGVLALGSLRRREHRAVVVLVGEAPARAERPEATLSADWVAGSTTTTVAAIRSSVSSASGRRRRSRGSPPTPTREPPPPASRP